MNCQKCGSALNAGQNFCPVCGNSVVELDTLYNSQNNSSPIINSTNESTAIDKNSLYSMYIGKHANEIQKGGYSFCTLIFGPIYFLYRKMYLYGFIWILINSIINPFIGLISNGLNYFVSVISMFVMGFFTKKIYLKKIQKDVDELYLKNSYKSKEELMSILMTKGGTSIPAIFLGLLAVPVSLLLSGLYLALMVSLFR